MEKNSNKNLMKTAAALKYDPTDQEAPVLAAFGQGYLAEKIIQTAKQEKIPIMPDPELTSLLASMSVGDEIPPELYEVVARVLVFVSQLDKQYGEKLENATGESD